MVARTITWRVTATLALAFLLAFTTHSPAQNLAQPAQVHPGQQGIHRAGAMSKADTALRQLAAEFDAHALRNAGNSFLPSNAFLQFSRGRVVVEATAATTGTALQQDLEVLGLQDAVRYGDAVSGRLPVGRIRNAAQLNSLQSIAAAYPPIFSVGAVTSQGDAALRADEARLPAVHDVDGSGFTIGVLSDSYDLSPFTQIHADDDIASGDLPAGNPVLSDGEYAGCGVLVNCIDEGRAMLQIAHDLAPGAGLLFHTALPSPVAFANGIQDLANAGADVIVDDVIYLNEPMFQDGVIAQAVDAAVAGGAMYFSAAGNSGRRSYEAPFVDSGEDFCIDFDLNGICDPIFELVGDMHDFDPGPGVDVYQSITIPVGGTLQLAMQWDSPFGNVNTGDGPDNDHIVVLVDITGGVMLAISANDNVLTGAPYEVLQYQNFDGTYGGPTGTSFNLIITFDDIDSPGPPADLIKTIIYSGGSDYNEHLTNSPTLTGHANAAGAVAVGAAYWGDTPEFGTSPPILEPFSSAGGVPILFDTDGDPLPAPVLRPKPEIVAADGVSTTFFFSPDGDGDGFPDFFGTSAAAPHAAAIAALMLEASPGADPQQIRDAMRNSAIDMGTAGFDPESGSGLVQADAAITELLGTPPSNDPPTAGFTFTVNELSVDFTDASTDSDGTVTNWNWDFGDGNGDNVQNPSHNYATGGTYTVTLTVIDDDGDSDDFSQDVTVSEPNNPPTADFTFSVNGLGVDFTDASTDSDGTVTSWNWDFGDGNGDNAQSPSHTYASGGTYTVTLTVTDDDGDSDELSQDVTVSSGASFAVQTAVGQLLTWGSVSGNFTATHDNGGQVQSITEESTRGNPANRVSRLRFDWTFNVAPGATVMLYANSWATPSGDNDQFQFSYSTDGSNFTPMFTVAGNIDDDIYQSFPLPPATNGTVLVRLEDTDRTGGNSGLDSVSVDHLYIRTDFDQAGTPPDAPTSLVAVAVSGSSIELSWTDNSGDELGFQVERSPDGVGGWSQVGATGTDGTAFTDTGLAAETTYFYRARAFNGAGSSAYSNVDSATTQSGPAAMHVGDLDGSATISGNGKRWTAEVTILVVDSDSAPVANASVSGDWSTNGSGNCTTDAGGTCIVDKGSNSNTPSVAYTVTGVSHATLPYDPGANTDPDGDSDGTTISVAQP